jgi:hypothetical protein
VAIAALDGNYYTQAITPNSWGASGLINVTHSFDRVGVIIQNYKDGEPFWPDNITVTNVNFFTLDVHSFTNTWGASVGFVVVR